MNDHFVPLLTGIHIAATPETWTRECFRNRWVLNGIKPVCVKFLRTDRLDEWIAGRVYKGEVGMACNLRVPEPFNAHYDDGPESGHHLLQQYLGKTGSSKEEILGELCARNKLWALPQIEKIILDFDRGINPLQLDLNRWLVFFIWAPRGVTQLHVKKMCGKWVVELEYPPYTRLDSSQDILFLNP